MGKGIWAAKDKTMPVGIGVGTAVSIVSTLVISAILAAMIESGKLSASAVSYGVVVMLMVSSVMGAVVSAVQIKGKRMIVCLITALCYLLALICITALFFDGMYQGIPATALVILGGGIIASLLPSGKRGNTHARKRKKRYG